MPTHGPICFFFISLSPCLRCGEETGPPLLGQQGKDRVQGAGEAHVEEGVCFIQHERFQLFVTDGTVWVDG